MAITQIDFTGGLNPQTGILAQPSNTCPVFNGVNGSYKIGALLKDTGYAKLGDTVQSGNYVYSLYDFRQDSSTQKLLCTADDSTDTDTELKYRTSGNWTEITAAQTAWAGVKTVKAEFESFIGYCFIVGYGNTWLPVGSLTGTTFSTSTNVTSMPNAKYIKRYRDRLYIANCYISPTAYPYRIYFSSVPSAGAITWTVAGDFLDVDYSEAITGLSSNWDRLVVFTEKSAYMYDQSSWKKVWEYGAYHRTIDNIGPYMFFANPDGVFVSSGGQPENISDYLAGSYQGSVIDYIKACTDPTAMMGKVVDREYHLYVGNVTVGDFSYSNCLLTFNIPTRSWRARELYNTVTSLESYLTGGKRYLYFGTTSGEVFRKGKYTDSTIYVSDGGDGTASGSGTQPIQTNFELSPQYLGNLEFEKKILKLRAFADRAQGLNIKARVIDRNKRILTPYVKLGQLTKYVNEFDISVDNGVFLQIAGSEYSKNPYFSLQGLEFDVDKFSEIIK